MLDLVADGSSWEEVVHLAKEIEKAGATIINTGIGWHEARIPTIATMVPRGGFKWVTKRMMGEVNIPLVTTNRFNMPGIAEQALADGCADMISMARPFLADENLVLKSMQGREDEINTCIGCNQACLDHTFNLKVCSCLVNPRACHETELNYLPTDNKKKIAVVGAGPAGLAAATIAAERGHDVDLFEASAEIGGQFNMAKKIPGKEEFYDQDLIAGGYSEVLLCTGVNPRTPSIPGIDHPKSVSYVDVLTEKVEVGGSVAIIGAGGIGFDVSEYLSTQKGHSTEPSPRKIYLLKRSKGKHGKNLGKTTGWIHRSSLKMKAVDMIANVTYDRIDDDGLHIQVEGESKVLDVDHVVICAGQEPLRELQAPLAEAGVSVHLLGGADEAAELDAKRAIDQAARLVATL